MKRKIKTYLVRNNIYDGLLFDLLDRNLYGSAKLEISRVAASLEAQVKALAPVAGMLDEATVEQDKLEKI